MGFTFDGVSSGQMGIPSRMSVQNRIPKLRNSTDQVAGRDGVFDFGNTLSERVIQITCLIPPGLDAATLLERKDRIVEWLDPGKGLRLLELDQEPGRQYLARLEDGVSFTNLVRNADTFELNFFCPDPFAYAKEDEVFTLTGSGDIRRRFGNVASHPVYEVRGSLADETQELVFLVNGEQVHVCGPLCSGEVLSIDTEDMTARIADRNALGQMKELNFPYLKTGINTVTIGEGSGTFDSLTIRARSRWL